MADAGFSGVITASTIDPYWSIDGATGPGAGNTVASTGVACPAGSTGTVPGNTGTGSTSGCEYGQVPGYSGTGENSDVGIPR